MSTSPLALSPAQVTVASALASGSKRSAAARAANVTRQTVYNWLHHNPDFARYVQELRGDYVNSIRSRVNTLSDLALTALERVLNDPRQPGAVQVRAAVVVLTRSQDSKMKWALPMPIDDPKFQNALDLVDEINAERTQPHIPTELDRPPNLSQFDAFDKNSVGDPTLDDDPDDTEEDLAGFPDGLARLEAELHPERTFTTITPDLPGDDAEQTQSEVPEGVEVFYDHNNPHRAVLSSPDPTLIGRLVDAFVKRPANLATSATSSAELDDAPQSPPSSRVA